MYLRSTGLIVLFLVFMAITSCSQTPPPETSSQSMTLEPGVSQTLAKWRAANYSNVSYKLNITLEKQAPLMKGDIEIHVTLTDEGAKNDLILDWRDTQFTNDKDKPYANVISVNETEKPLVIQGAEHLRLPRQTLKTGENIIKIQFASPVKTSGAAITRYIDKEDGAEYIYSLFVPSDASTAFPVFDQPDLKARFQLNLILSSDWKAVSNTNTEYVTKSGGISFWNYKETKPISTYVFAFAAGDFELVSDSGFRESLKNERISFPDNSVSLTKIYVRKSQAEKFKQHANEVFRLNREGIKYLESYFDYKFPFPKYDLVLIPEFPFGGMEHAGATFLREDSIIFPTEPTANNYIARANVVFHEAAHQWFGDTVTMKWFDDLWLKEGFAEFMAYKTLEKVMPQYNAWKVFYERNKQAAYLTDSTKGTTPIYQEIPNLSAAKSAYGNIVYRKAPSFLRQAEFYLGEDKFQTAVRAFLKKHEFANAEWTDLVTEFETVSGKNLSLWSKAWVKERGLSVIRFDEESVENGKSKEYRLNQYDLFKDAADIVGDNDEINFLREVNFNTFVKFKNGETRVTKFITSKTDIPTVLKVPSEIDYIFPNYQDYGYGIFLLDNKSRDYVLKNIQTEKDDFLRSMMWGSLWDSVREAELDPKDYVELVIKNINVEKDESTISSLLGRISTAMNYYLSDAQSAEIAPRLENLLINKMQTAPTLGQRITFYRAFLSVASTDKAKQMLKDSLSAKYQVQDFKLRARDKFDIATKLLILGDKDAPQILADLEKTETSDDAKRYAYAAKAGIGTPANKAKFWNDFVNNKDISESWIESAFGVWNSSKHADLTLPYLEFALDELPNLKKNRKIFFVNGWLGAFIGGQKSEEALATVNKFLAAHLNLDKDLRLKILENSDGLERAVKIRAKYAVNN